MRVKPVRVYLPADEREAAEMFAAEQNRSVSNLLRHALSGGITGGQVIVRSVYTERPCRGRRGGSREVHPGAMGRADEGREVASRKHDEIPT